MSERWWKGGIRFECQATGRCCISHGDSSFVYVNLEDRRRLGTYLGLGGSEFTRRFCRPLDGRFVLVDAPDGKSCVLLKDGRCVAYEARPTQCRTWPFWPELLEDPERFEREVAGFCEGCGRGRLWSEAEIERIAEVQRRAEEEAER